MNRAGVIASVLTTVALLFAAGGLNGQERDSMPEMGGMNMPMMSPGGWPMPSMPDGLKMPMLPGIRAYRHPITPYRASDGVDVASLPMVAPREVYAVAHGDSIALDARRVRKVINGRTVVMFGFNGQHPGPLIRVAESSTVVVNFTNSIDQPTTVHWHGLRLDNRFDGVPYLTQEPVAPGESFRYELFFPDAGVYWYHPHVREDIQQELGLYGNMLVESAAPGYWDPVNAEEFVILDDLLLDHTGDVFPFGAEAANFTMMGRFGNMFLVNGEPDYSLDVNQGDVVRFYLTNVSNTRTYNLVFGDVPVKVVGADVGRFEREEWVRSVVIAPAQRYIVEARFERPGPLVITNQVQAINHFLGEYYPAVDTIGVVNVSDRASELSHESTFMRLRENADVIADIDRYRPHFDREPDREMVLTVKIGDIPNDMLQIMAMDTTYYPPVEWSDAMPMMNWVTNGTNVEWVLRDAASGQENMDIDWDFEVGSVVKIRFFNDPESMHPMGHPIHLHGQRFLVVSRNGVPNRNLVWKDTALVPVGQTMDIILDVTNPGDWMVHCHIAEHIEAGMMSVFTVPPSGN